MNIPKVTILDSVSIAGVTYFDSITLLLGKTSLWLTLEEKFSRWVDSVRYFDEFVGDSYFLKLYKSSCFGEENDSVEKVLNIPTFGTCVSSTILKLFALGYVRNGIWLSWKSISIGKID